MGHTTELQVPRVTPTQRIQRTLVPMRLQAPRATEFSAAPRPHTWLSAPSQWRGGKGRKSTGRESPAAGSYITKLGWISVKETGVALWDDRAMAPSSVRHMLRIMAQPAWGYFNSIQGPSYPKAPVSELTVVQLSPEPTRLAQMRTDRPNITK